MHHLQRPLLAADYAAEAHQAGGVVADNRVGPGGGVGGHFVAGHFAGNVALVYRKGAAEAAALIALWPGHGQLGDLSEQVGEFVVRVRAYLIACWLVCT